MKNQLYIVEKSVEVKNKRGRKSDDQQSFLNYFFTSVVSTSMSNNKVSVVLKKSDFIPKTSRWRLFKEANKKENMCYLMIPIIHCHLLEKERDLSFDIWRFKRSDSKMGM